MKPVHIISPLVALDKGGTEALFDDCPLCQDLKRLMEAGDCETFSVPVDREEDDWEFLENIM